MLSALIPICSRYLAVLASLATIPVSPKTPHWITEAASPR